MSTHLSDRALTTLLSADVEKRARQLGDNRSPIGLPLPSLDERVELLLSAMHGPDHMFTPEERAAARSEILDAMAAEIASELFEGARGIQVGDVVSSPQEGSDTFGVSKFSNLDPNVVKSRFFDLTWAACSEFLRGIVRLPFTVAEAFAMQGVRMVAVPLIALLVVGTMWTGTLYEWQSLRPEPSSTSNEDRSLESWAPSIEPKRGPGTTRGGAPTQRTVSAIPGIEPPSQRAASATAPNSPLISLVSPAPIADATAAKPSFLWPARGRVIAGFGSQPSGQPNDGINIALDEGTRIRAAANGVVAYAGNDLKGYGNLVLLRHENGYVTAYAHLSRITVTRGATVREGQIIGHAGLTGNVTSPQLHFEIRKGATPVDPLQHLARY